MRFPWWRDRRSWNRRQALLEEEIRSHLQMVAQDNVDRGESPSDAERSALREFGNVDLVAEVTRDQWGWVWLDDLLQDLRYGVRTLRKNPAFSLLAAFTLAVGIGATTVVFSVLDNVLLHPLPFRNTDRQTIFYVHDSTQTADGGRPAYSVAEFLDYQEHNRVFEQMMGASNTDILYTRGSHTQQFDGAVVTSNAFEFLGVAPFLGRPITPDDGKPGFAPNCVVSYRLWQREFGGDPQLIGRTLTLNGFPRKVAAIMPPRFLFDGADVWLPITLSRSGGADQPQYIGALGMLKPGVTLEQAAADLNTVAKQISKIYPRDYPGHFEIRTINFTDAIVGLVGRFKPMLLTLIAGVALVLLIACSNVANLLLTRATVRGQEMMVRTSIGASRSRLVRQLFTEGVLLAALGCLLGCVFAYYGLLGVAAVIPRRAVATETVIELNHAALLFALGLGFVSTILSGLAPAVHAVGGLQARVARAGRGSISTPGQGRLRAGLMILELSFSMVLLVGAGLMMRSFAALSRVELGFNPSHVLHARIPFPAGTYNTRAQQKVFFEQVLARIKSLPGVIAAAEAVSVPPYGGQASEVDVSGKSHSESWNAMVQLCSEGYFQTLERRLLRGRLLSERDIDSTREVAVINQTLARDFFGDANPLGQKIKFNFFDGVPDAPHDAYFEVIGVVTDARNRGLQDSPLPEAYLPYTIAALGNRAILVKTALPPDAVSASLRQAIWAVDSGVGLADVGSLDDFLKERAYTQPQFALISLGVFAGVGLLLAIVGVFSVMQYSVSLQTREFGLRVALGAQPQTILARVLLDGFRIAGAGVAVGLFASLGLTRLLASQIWGISATDPLTFGGAGMLLTLATLAACYVPARRAMRADPMVALRYE